MHVTVNGARLYFDVEGAGLVPDGAVMRQKPVVVLVHGGPGADHSHYKPAWSPLSEIAQLIFYDHRGNGRSDLCGPDTWTLDQWADDLKGLCDALGLEKPIVAGTSFGGFVTQAYATRYPNHPGKLILTSTAARMDFEQVFAAFGRLAGAEAEAVARAYWTDPNAEQRQRYAEVCVPHYQLNRADAVDWLARSHGPPDTALHFNGPRNEQGRMDFRAALGRVQCPVLVLAGEQDPITPIAFSEEIVACLPDGVATFHRFDRCGHGVVADRPAAAMDVIRRFIQS